MVKKKDHLNITGYDDNNAILPLIIELPQMIGYCKEFDYGAIMNFICDDKTLLKKYMKKYRKNSET